MTSASLMHQAGHPNQCSGTTQWDGVGRDQGFQDGEDTYAPLADSCQCMGKTTTIL